MKIKLTTFILLTLISLPSFAAHPLLLDDYRDTRFELNNLNFDTGTYAGKCDREAIKDNIFANDSRELRSEYALVRGAKGYFFDDLERCSNLNFSAMVIKNVNFKTNELKVELYKAAWSKDWGLKPIRINAIFDQVEITAKCKIQEIGLIFKDIHLNCQLFDKNNASVGTMKFVEH